MLCHVIACHDTGQRLKLKGLEYVWNSAPLEHSVCPCALLVLYVYQPKMVKWLAYPEVKS